MRKANSASVFLRADLPQGVRLIKYTTEPKTEVQKPWIFNSEDSLVLHYIVTSVWKGCLKPQTVLHSLRLVHVQADLHSLHLRKEHWILSHRVELLAVLQGLQLFRRRWSNRWFSSPISTTKNFLLNLLVSNRTIIFYFNL